MGRNSTKRRNNRIPAKPNPESASATNRNMLDRAASIASGIPKPLDEITELEGMLYLCLLSSKVGVVGMRQALEFEILVPDCGTNPISLAMYDLGFQKITSLDSRQVISQMLAEHVRTRKDMRWRIGDITLMESGNFDVIVTRDGLNKFVDHPDSATDYFNVVKRISGKYICLLTSFEPRVLGLIFSNFRFGWTATAHLSSSGTYAFDFDRDCTSTCALIKTNTLSTLNEEGSMFVKAINEENATRQAYIGGVLPYTLKDLEGCLRDYKPGRRVMMSLSDVFKKAVLLDAREHSYPIPYGVYLIPHFRTSEWRFISEEGQWRVVRESEAARLLMVFLDSSTSTHSMDHIKAGLSPLVEQLTPRCDGQTFQIQYFTTAEEFSRKSVLEMESDVAGKVFVENVTYSSMEGRCFRHLIIQKPGFNVRMEALLSWKASSGEEIVFHNFLSSQYHNATMSGLLLIQQYLKLCDLDERLSKVVVLGMGAGLLPMFMKRNLPTTPIIEVVEPDPKVLRFATKWFGLKQDGLLKVHICDDVMAFIDDLAKPDAKEKVGLLVVDLASEVDVTPAFIRKAKDSLANGGLFIMTSLSMSATDRAELHRHIGAAQFGIRFCLPLERDENEVVYAVNVARHGVDLERFHTAKTALEKHLEGKGEPWCRLLIDLSKSIEPVALEKYPS